VALPLSSVTECAIRADSRGAFSFFNICLRLREDAALALLATPTIAQTETEVDVERVILCAASLVWSALLWLWTAGSAATLAWLTLLWLWIAGSSTVFFHTLKALVELSIK
jgi:hypothetical protein